MARTALANHSKHRRLRGWRVLASLAFLAIILLGLGFHEWPDETQPLFDFSQILLPGGTLSQPLNLSKDGLYRLDIALIREGTVTGSVSLRVTADTTGAQEIASAAVPAERAEDISQVIRRPYGFVAFRFPPQEIPGSRQVWLWLESKADAPLKVRSLKNAEGDHRFAFKAYYHRSAIGNLAIFFSRLHDRALYAGPLLLVYVALVVSLAQIFLKVALPCVLC